jgi:hypothetical protein
MSHRLHPQPSAFPTSPSPQSASQNSWRCPSRWHGSSVLQGLLIVDLATSKGVQLRWHENPMMFAKMLAAACAINFGLCCASALPFSRLGMATAGTIGVLSGNRSVTFLGGGQLWHTLACRGVCRVMRDPGAGPSPPRQIRPRFCTVRQVEKLWTRGRPTQAGSGGGSEDRVP